MIVVLVIPFRRFLFYFILFKKKKRKIHNSETIFVVVAVTIVIHFISRVELLSVFLKKKLATWKLIGKNK